MQRSRVCHELWLRKHVPNPKPLLYSNDEDAHRNISRAVTSLRLLPLVITIFQKLMLHKTGCITLNWLKKATSMQLPDRWRRDYRFAISRK
jgi:hypothetical protein